MTWYKYKVGGWTWSAQEAVTRLSVWDLSINFKLIVLVQSKGQLSSLWINNDFMITCNQPPVTVFSTLCLFIVYSPLIKREFN